MSDEREPTERGVQADSLLGPVRRLLMKRLIAEAEFVVHAQLRRGRRGSGCGGQREHERTILRSGHGGERQQGKEREHDE